MTDRPHAHTPRPEIIVASVLLGIVLIVCTILVTRTMIKVKGFGQQITVTGAAFKPITSNYGIWQGTFSASASDLDPAYAIMKRDLQKVESFLKDRGFASEQYEVGTVQIQKNYNRDRVFTGYTLRQQVKVELPDVSRITALAKAASSLIEDGVEFESTRPRYLYTGLDSLKLEMIEAATENAKLRAQQIAETTDRTVGAPTSARVGVFQIRPLHSQEVSSYGISDVTSIEKEIVSTVHVSFLIE